MATTTTGELWELSVEFGENGRGPRGFHGAQDLATRYRHEIAVADYYNSQVVIYSIEGDYFSTIPVQGDPSGVAVTKTGHQLVIPRDRNAKVNVFNEDGTLAYKFLTVPPVGLNETYPQPLSVAVQQNGAILVGDVLNKTVTEHDPVDGSRLRTIPVEFKPYKLDVDNQGRLIFSSWDNGVHVTDNNGRAEFCIRPVINRKHARITTGVCFDSRGIYIATRCSCLGNGHIHRYDAEGHFMSCITQDLFEPMGIAVTPDGQLAVADTNSVKIYKRVR